MNDLNLSKSIELSERAAKVIPGGTNSAARTVISFGDCEGFPIRYPRAMERAEGSHLYDLDGNDFIDYSLGLGPVILGHVHPKIKEALKGQLEKAWIHSMNHEVEVEVCEKIVKHVPCADMVFMMNTGSAATSAALKIARSHTRKQKIVKFEGHFHGWHDWSIFHNYPAAKLDVAGIAKSVVDDVIVLPWNDLEVAEKVLTRQAHEIAAVITEAYLFNGGVIPPEKGYLEGLRKITQEQDIVLIFDEVITGFRLGLSGAQGMLGVTPDIATFAKSLANGFPISALTGKKELMQSINEPGGTFGVRLWIAGTYNSNPISMTAALATLKELEKEGTYKHLYDTSGKLMKGLRDTIEDVGIKAIVQGPGPGFSLFFTGLEEIKSYQQVVSIPLYPNIKRAVVFFQEMVNRGIFVMPNRIGRMYVSVAHDENDINRTIEAADEAFREAKKVQ